MLYIVRVIINWSYIKSKTLFQLIFLALLIPASTFETMKSFSLFLLLLSATDASPQFGLFGGGRSGWPVVSTKFVSTVYRQDAKREIVRFGPLVLAGKDVSGSTSLLMDVDRF
jgi:hypothetical protein